MHQLPLFQDQLLATKFFYARNCRAALLIPSTIIG